MKVNLYYFENKEPMSSLDGKNMQTFTAGSGENGFLTADSSNISQISVYRSGSTFNKIPWGIVMKFRRLLLC